MESSNGDVNTSEIDDGGAGIGDVRSVVVLCAGSQHQIDEGVEGTDVTEIAGAHHSDEDFCIDEGRCLV